MISREILREVVVIKEKQGISRIRRKEGRSSSKLVGGVTVVYEHH